METGTTVQITMPAMGESVTEGTILEWLKGVGDAVDADEGIVEVSTDKVDTEIPAPAAGVLTKVLVEPDETVPVGTVLGEITVNGASGTEHAGTEHAGTATPPDYASDESAVEEAEHGPAAEQEALRAKEQTGNGGAPLVEVVLPQMGESVQEGTVLEWLKQVGDPVAEGETIVEISTDKVDAEIPAPAAGTLVEILAEPDQVVRSGSVVARIAAGAAASAPEPEAPAPQPPGNGNATPVAARIASSHGVDVGSVQGTGPRG